MIDTSFHGSELNFPKQSYTDKSSSSSMHRIGPCWASTSSCNFLQQPFTTINMLMKLTLLSSTSCFFILCCKLGMLYYQARNEFIACWGRSPKEKCKWSESFERDRPSFAFSVVYRMSTLELHKLDLQMCRHSLLSDRKSLWACMGMQPSYAFPHAMWHFCHNHKAGSEEPAEAPFG